MSGFLNRKGLLSSLTQETQFVYTSSGITLSGTNNQKVFVDTTGGQVSITLPSGSKGQIIEIIDAGDVAGTNPITVVGTIDGAANTSIEADGASRTFVYYTAWESGGGLDQFFRRVAATGQIVAKEPDTLSSNQLAGGDLGTTYLGDTTDFSDAEANVDQDASGWGNNSIQSNLIISATIEDQTIQPFPGTISQYTDGNTSSSGYSFAGGQYVVFDLGSVKSFDYAEFKARVNTSYEGKPHDATVSVGSLDDGVAFDQDLISGNFSSASSTTFSGSFTAVNKRYVRFRCTTVGGSAYLEEALVSLTAYESSNNSFQYRPLTNGDSTNFDSSTLSVKDENGTNLGDSDILIEYSLDGSTWNGSQLSLNTFKALGVLTGTYFWLRFEMVGDKRLGSVSISTASSYAELSSGALILKAQGVTTGGVLNSALQTHTLSGDAVTQDLNMASYNNFLVDMATATTGVTLTFSNPVIGQTYGIMIRQTDTGVSNIDVTWPGSILVSGGANPSAISYTDDAVDFFQFYYDGTNFILVNEVVTEVNEVSGGGSASTYSTISGDQTLAYNILYESYIAHDADSTLTLPSITSADAGKKVRVERAGVAPSVTLVATGLGSEFAAPGMRFDLVGFTYDDTDGNSTEELKRAKYMDSDELYSIEWNPTADQWQLIQHSDSSVLTYSPTKTDDVTSATGWSEGSPSVTETSGTVDGDTILTASGSQIIEASQTQTYTVTEDWVEVTAFWDSDASVGVWEVTASSTTSGGGSSITDSDSPYSASVGEEVYVDTSSAVATVTLPDSSGLSAGDTVRVIDQTRSFNTNNCTVGRNSSNIDGSASDATLSTAGTVVTFKWSGNATTGWIQITDK